MPTYDYICDDCAHEFEAFESIKADPRKICPACGKDTLRRKIGPGAAILFKGSGFYITDYRSDSYKEKAKSESGNGSSSSGGEGGKTASSTPAASASSPPPPPPSSGGSPST